MDMPLSSKPSSWWISSLASHFLRVRNERSKGKYQWPHQLLHLQKGNGKIGHFCGMDLAAISCFEKTLDVRLPRSANRFRHNAWPTNPANPIPVLWCNHIVDHCGQFLRCGTVWPNFTKFFMTICWIFVYPAPGLSVTVGHFPLYPIGTSKIGFLHQIKEGSCRFSQSNF